MRLLDRLLVTGGAGFIGSAFIRWLFENTSFDGRLINFDRLTYAADLSLLEAVKERPGYRFVQGDINDREQVEALCKQEHIEAIVHFAAETHVDRSIDSAELFVESNVKGTLSLLEVVRKIPTIHFHHVSTDEVYGALDHEGYFHEESPYRPNSPYAASKAASDHLVRAFARTYCISTTISHCSNNYGPGQYPEKLIPLMVLHAMTKKPFPLYGRGMNVRDWLYVDDHAEGIWKILQKGRSGETYDMGGRCEVSNLEMLRRLLAIFAEETGQNAQNFYERIQFVADRPGHDFRYAIDSSKIKRDLHWEPRMRLDEGLRATVQWYIRKAGFDKELLAR